MGAAAALVAAGASVVGVVGIQTLLPTHNPLVDTCPAAPPGWLKQVDNRSSDGHYRLHLDPCQTLWFNSGSVVLGGDPVLGGGIADENVVLLFRATKSTDVTVGVGSAADIGHEWWATAASDLKDTANYWIEQAMQPPNCSLSAGCRSLRVFFYIDGTFEGQESVTRPSSS